MRKILFRGNRKDNSEWVYGYYNESNGTAYIDYDEPFELEGKLLMRMRSPEVIPETVGQYTGLTDKNGTKIFEGDIVEMPAYAGGKYKTVVYFENGKFAVDGSNYVFKDICSKRMRVIGNIHDNPELLKGGAERRC